MKRQKTAVDEEDKEIACPDAAKLDRFWELRFERNLFELEEQYSTTGTFSSGCR